MLTSLTYVIAISSNLQVRFIFSAKVNKHERETRVRPTVIYPLTSWPKCFLEYITFMLLCRGHYPFWKLFLYVIYPIAIKFVNFIYVLIIIAFTKNEVSCLKALNGIRLLSIKRNRRGVSKLWSKLDLNLYLFSYILVALALKVSEI